MKADLRGRSVIVTGGAGGIGSATARLFAENGAYVYICDVNDDAGNELVAEITSKGGRAKYFHCDVTSEADCKKVVADAALNSGGVDIMIHNTGHNVTIKDGRGKISTYEYAAWQKSIDISIDSYRNFNKYVIPIMKAKGRGRIINTGSVTGFRMGLRNQCAYNMVKSTIHHFTRTLAIELAGYGITVNCVIPGSTWTKQFYVNSLTDESMNEKFLSHIPLKMPNSPEDIAYGSLYLCSNEAERVTGVLLNIDGGWSSGYIKG